MQGLTEDEACRILHEAGATGKSTRSFRLPPALRRAAKALGGPAAVALAGLSWNG
jgi:hypothetical protein